MTDAFIAACNYEIAFGKHAGQRVAQVGGSDKGLDYLTWLQKQPWIMGPLRKAIETYLTDPAMGARVEATIEY